MIKIMIIKIIMIMIRTEDDAWSNEVKSVTVIVDNVKKLISIIIIMLIIQCILNL